ncbi:MAG: hypothetical protein ACK5JT_20185 [Hyphomicrobiaceae bacterium]
MTNPNWKPWVFYRDSQGYWKRTMKDLNGHPATLELANDATFVERARLWAWANAGPTSTPNTGSNWPPGRNPRATVADYWYELLQRKRNHQPDEYVEPDGLTTLVAYAKQLAEENPLIEYSG